MADNFNTLDIAGSSQITDNINIASVRDTGANDSLNVSIVDASGNQITSFGSSLQYAEDTASTAGDMLTMAGVVRQDTPGTLVDADGDRTQLQVNATGGLRVDGSAVTQPISAASLPLPTGAATEATLATRASEATLASIDGNIDVALSTRASEATLSSIDTSIDVALSTRASEATLTTVATNTGNTTTQVTTLNTNFGAQADTAATTDTGTFSFMAFVKRLLTHLTDIKANERNSSDTVIASGTFTATNTTADFTNLSAQGAHFIIDITSIAGSNLTLRIQGKDPASGKYYDLIVSKSLNSTGTTIIKVHPGLPPVANVAAADGLPLTWRAVVTPNNANNITYSVGVNYLE